MQLTKTHTCRTQGLTKLAELHRVGFVNQIKTYDGQWIGIGLVFNSQSTLIFVFYSCIVISRLLFYFCSFSSVFCCLYLCPTLGSSLRVSLFVVLLHNILYAPVPVFIDACFFFLFSSLFILFLFAMTLISLCAHTRLCANFQDSYNNTVFAIAYDHSTQFFMQLRRF